jgi:hypothetical protein
VEHLLGGLVQFGGEPVGGDDLAVEVAVKAREVAAGDLQADPVAGAEDLNLGPPPYQAYSRDAFMLVE